MRLPRRRDEMDGLHQLRGRNRLPSFNLRIHAHCS
jgi:hypothetical protein